MLCWRACSLHLGKYDRPLSLTSLGLSREHIKEVMAGYTMCTFIYYVAWSSIIVLLPHYSKAKDTQSAHG